MAKLHICSVKTFSSKALSTSQRKQFIGTSSILAWGKSHVLPTELPFFLHHVSTINYYYWSIEHNCLLFLFFKSYFTLFLFLFISHLFKKSVHGPGPWQGVHGPSPWKWSMDPVQSGSMCCPRLFWPFCAFCQLLMLACVYVF